MTDKYEAEKTFWKDEISWYVKWYENKVPDLYGILAPTNFQKITHYPTIALNAIETWINLDRWRYCKHLFVEPTYFAGKRILEIGCGPLGLSRWFVGAEVYAVDPLIEDYLGMGYSLGHHGINYFSSIAEKLPFEDSFFDAVISVNAIDHVDDFVKACQEVGRVVKSDGEIRLEVHYHTVTVTEPHSLNDDEVARAFSTVSNSPMCIAKNKSTTFYPPGTHSTNDIFAVWATKNYLYNAVEALC